jgi:plastocyanin
MSIWKKAAIVGMAGAAGAGVLVGASGSARAAAPVASTSAFAVSITNGGACGQIFCFTPQTFSVVSGTKVTWTDNTGAPHTVTRCDTVNCPTTVGPGTGTDPAFGLSLSPGLSVSVTFRQPGTYNYYCHVHGYPIMHGTITVTVNPLKVLNTSLPAGTAGTAYSAKLKAGGGDTIYHWSLASGTLPPGLKIATGKISGTPTTVGTSSFTVKVTDGETPPMTATKALSITIG